MKLQTIFLAAFLGLWGVLAHSQAPIAQPSSSDKPTTADAPASTKAAQTTTQTEASTTAPLDKPNKPQPDDKLIVIATGSVTGVYYPAGGALCRLLNRERKQIGIRCAIESTPGSVYNLDSLRAAEVDLAIAQSDWQEHAYNGTGVFSNKGRFDKLRFLFSLHTEAITIVVPKASPIIKFDDLKGRIVNVGPEGSGARATMGDIMKAKGWSKSDFKSLSELRPSEQARALCNGSIDAIVLATGHPNGLVQEIAGTCAIRLLNINDPVIQKFIVGNPEFSQVTIPAGLYNGVTDPASTFGIKATVVTTSDVSDAIAYNVTRVLFDNLETFKTLHPVFSSLNPEKMASEGRTVPYHNGALKYFKEKGLLKE